jgi:predicted nucleotidyltransferase
MRILLSGVVGSQAYGLAGPDSDIDRLGVFTWPTALMFGLTPPNDSIVTTAPDSTCHEAAKAARLMLASNPTVLELLFLESYEIRTPLGDELVGIRSAFPTARRVRDAYCGYAVAQCRKLLNRGDGSFSADTRKRTAKHSRHLLRLTHQGLELYTTGTLRVRLADPQKYLDFGEQVAKDPSAAEKLIADTMTRFDEAKTALPDEPRVAVVEGWLHRVRRAYYESDGEAR